MKLNRRSIWEDLTSRRGEMSTPALIFLILGIVFAVMVMIAVIGAALLLPAVQQARGAARRTQSRNNLKQIGLAIHNYHDVYGSFPINVYSSDDEPQSAWMTGILPFIDQAPLYDQIDFDQPWLSQTNWSTFTVRIPAYTNPAVEGNITTVVDGIELATAHYAGNSQAMLDNKSWRFRDTTDGTSNTFLAGEVTTGFKAWGDPTNVRDPAAGFGDTPTQFGSPHADGMVVQMLMMDGSVRPISTDIDPELLKALATPAGNEAIRDF